jgi:cytoskeletal protein RodZ
VSIGKALETARVESGLTLDEVSEATRIRRTIVGAIEQDDFSLCGGEFYARGHLRSIANVVGADPGPLLAEFDQLGTKEQPPAPRDSFEPDRSPRPERRSVNWSTVLAAALAVLLVVGVVRLLLGDDARGQATAGGSATATPLPAPGPATATASTATASTAPAPRAQPVPRTAARPPARPAGVTVRLAATAPSRLNVTDAAGRVLFRGTLGAGQARTFADRTRLVVVFGNAGTVRVTVNGRDLGVAGPARAGLRREFRPLPVR